MALTTNVARFHKEIFPKVRYDEMLEQYRINIGDYILLRLTKRQFHVLEKICQKNNIYIEKIPEQLSIKDSENLFIRLHNLKKELQNATNLEAKKELEKQIDNIRTKLFEGHLKTLYIIIYTAFSDLEETPYKDDILQSAYISLLNHIDIYNPFASRNSFRHFFNNYAKINIIRNSIGIKNNTMNKEYNDMLVAKEQLESSGCATIENLSKETNLEAQKIKELMVLEQILNPQSTESLIEEESNTPDLLDEYQDEPIHQELLRELLLLILETLPKGTQKEVLIKRYGLKGNEPETFEEITASLGLSNRQRTQQHSADAIENFQNQVYAKYIKELVEGYSQITLSEGLEILPIDEESLEYEKLELYLMKQLPKEELLELIMCVNIKYREALLLYFEINQNTDLSNKEKSEQLGITHKRFLELKRKGLLNLRTIIKHKYILNQPNENINTVLDYLMYDYLRKGLKKTRKKEYASSKRGVSTCR